MVIAHLPHCCFYLFCLQYVTLRTRYSELMTLTSQYIKFITDTQRRLEEEEVRHNPQGIVGYPQETNLNNNLNPVQPKPNNQTQTLTYTYRYTQPYIINVWVTRHSFPFFSALGYINAVS